jgi:hypothetical protein
MRSPNRHILALVMGFACGASISAGYASGDNAYGKFDQELVRACPSKHLDGLNFASLYEVIDNFTNKLPHSAQTTIRQSQDAACVGVQQGVSCDNYGAIRAAYKLRLIPRLVTAVCESGWTCSRPFECAIDGAR